MSHSTYYAQECPTCGRKLQVRVKYLGKQVVCQHCNATFTACDPSSALEPMESGSSLLDRAEQLIEAATRSGIGLGQIGSRY
ncbi:MAG: response regulator [Pirellulales bacterium]|nr:response regulator [Pirellulales bacterium]MBX3433997.1 response regulator [Pirellulales bacterium]